MRLAVIGTGYVGLVAGAGFSDFGNDVVCVDLDADRIKRLEQAEIPIHEPGLAELVKQNLDAGRLTFTTDTAKAVAGADVVILAVGTPQSEVDGSADLRWLDEAARQVGRALTGYAVIVTKSTVPVGTADRLRAILAKETTHPFAVASNPEFLKEGDAVNDFMKPARVIIGSDDDKATRVLRSLYQPFVRISDRIMVMDVRSAELTKYASNAMLAVRISFMNELAMLAEKVGADIDRVRKAVGADPRIGPKFLFPGPGFGGSCLVGAETVVLRERGVIRLARLDSLLPWSVAPAPAVAHPESLEVLAVPDVAGPPRFCRVAAITRRPYEGDLIEVRTKMGRRVHCTTDHPFVVVDSQGGSPRMLRADELDDDCWLPLASSEADNLETSAPAFDVLGSLAHLEIPDEQVIVHVGDRVRVAAATETLRLVVRDQARLHDIRRTGTLRLHEARAAKLDLMGATLGTSRSGTYVPTTIPSSVGFWRVIGLYAAEGSISTDLGRDGARRMRMSWAFHPTKEEHLVDEVVQFWAGLGIEAKIFSPPTSRKVTVSSRILCTWLMQEFGLSADCYGQRVPDALWTAPRTHKRAFLSGVWHGDGSWSYVANRRGVVLEHGCASRELADGIVRLLSEEGIIASWKIGRPPGATVDTHFVRISGADQVERLFDFVDPRDRDAIEKAIASQEKRIKPTGFRRDRVTRVRIVSLERRPYQGHVYSLEVPDAGTFVATGGLVVHNCFPKDLKALAWTAKDNAAHLEVIEAADRANARQKKVLGGKLRAHFGEALRGARIAVWGLAFKPETDDIRESPALTLIADLREAGATVVGYDPAAMPNIRAQLGDALTLTKDMYEAAAGADALVLVTEWKQFRGADFGKLAATMKQRVVFDGRNIWVPEDVRAHGFTYHAIGRPNA